MKSWGRDIASLIDVFKKLGYILSRRQVMVSMCVFVMTIVGAAMETLGVSIIVPLVQSFISADQLLHKPEIAWVVDLLDIETATQLIVWISGGVVAIYLIKNAFMVLLSYVRVKFATMVKRELSVKMMHSYMSREYSYFLNVNTEDVLRGIGYDVSGVYEVLMQLFRIAAEVLTAGCICVYIFCTDVAIALGVVMVMGITLLALMMFFRNKMKVIGDVYRKYTVEVNKYLHESFQGIKDVYIFHKEQYFIDHYEGAFTKQQKIEVSKTIATESPAYIIEAVCVSGLIMVVGLKIVLGGNSADFVPQMAAFAIAAFRILPSIGRISAGFNQLIYSCPALNATHRHLKEVETFQDQYRVQKQISGDPEQKINFTTAIEAKGLFWKYPGADRMVMENLDMTIPKGKSVAIIGQSGAGKSTMADILLGLLVPDQGDIKVDGVSIYDEMESWKRTVGYVPQTVFLCDDTIRKNIAFGIADTEIDEQRLQRAVHQAQLTQAIAELPNGLDTLLGERGVRFSGGQRQRVAIARALYNDPDILILDEATAALDNDTESAVMEAIDALHGYKTLIIIAHRLSTIRNCDLVYEIADGKAMLRDKKQVISQ